MPEGPGGLFFLDSGAFSLYMLKVARRDGVDGFSFYESDEYWDYVDGYASFVKNNEGAIDFYANVDVMFEPRLSWRTMRYLKEEHGLNPVPVVHMGTEVRWITKYMDAGHDLIGLGGLASGGNTPPVRRWLDKVFDAICPPSCGRMPQVRTHGFAMTSHELMLRYPWWSVDSATWTKVGAFGSIMVPRKTRKGFDFTREPHIVVTSIESDTDSKHYDRMTGSARRDVDEWLEFIDLPAGKVGDDGEVIRHGVRTRHTERKIANLLYFEGLRKSIPDYPIPFRLPKQARGML